MADVEEFPWISGLITGYLNQDLYVEFETAAEAIASFARELDEATRKVVVEEIALFETRYHNDLAAEFKRRFWFDFDPEQGGQSIGAFFDMVRSILADPESYRLFDESEGAGH